MADPVGPRRVRRVAARRHPGPLPQGELTPASAAEQVWRPASDSGLPTGADQARWLARRCGLDETAIWEGGVVERVSTGLLATRIGLQPVGGQMLAAAEHIARQAWSR